MPGFLGRLVINMLGLLLARELVPGIEIVGLGTFIAAGLLLGIVNSLVRPIAIVLTLPLTILTLGLFLLFINAAMLGLVARMLDAFTIAGWGSALVGALIVSFTSWVASRYVGPKNEVEIIFASSKERY